jgi:hypothetical protein
MTKGVTQGFLLLGSWHSNLDLQPPPLVSVPSSPLCVASVSVKAGKEERTLMLMGSP